MFATASVWNEVTEVNDPKWITATVLSKSSFNLTLVAETRLGNLIPPPWVIVSDWTPVRLLNVVSAIVEAAEVYVKSFTTVRMLSTKVWTLVWSIAVETVIFTFPFTMFRAAPIAR